MTEPLADKTPDVANSTDDPEYLTNRLEQFQTWYDRKAGQAKARYLQMRTAAVVAGAIVPVLVNIEFSYSKILTSCLSVLVVVLVSLESVYHYREQWKNYRSTEQLLGHERVYFRARIGPYSGLDDQQAFTLLVERAERAIASENAATLSVMTLASEASHPDGIASINKL